MRTGVNCKYYEDASVKNGLTRGLTEAMLQGVVRDARIISKSKKKASKSSDANQPGGVRFRTAHFRYLQS